MNDVYYSLHVQTGDMITHRWDHLYEVDAISEPTLSRKFELLNEWNRIAMIGPDSAPKPSYHYWM